MSFVDFFSQEQLQNFLRPALSQGIDEAIEKQEWRKASRFLSAFIDSWALGGSMKQAWERWNHNCDPIALTVLTRANEIITLIGGTSISIPAPKNIPTYIELTGEELVEKREELCAQALRNEIAGVHFTSPVPFLPAAQLALGELRMEAKGQASLERFGPIGLLAPEAPSWEQCFGSAPAGRMGEELRLMCDLALLPSTPNRLANGQLQVTAWLLWNGPARALPVHRVAYELLRHISSGIPEACVAAGLQEEQGREIIGELIAIGALDRVS